MPGVVALAKFGVIDASILSRESRSRSVRPAESQVQDQLGDVTSVQITPRIYELELLLDTKIPY